MVRLHFERSCQLVIGLIDVNVNALNFIRTNISKYIAPRNVIRHFSFILRPMVELLKAHTMTDPYDAERRNMPS